MHKLARIYLTLCLIIFGAQDVFAQQMMLMGAGGAGNSSSGVAFSLAFVTNSDAASGTTPITQSGVNLGAASPNRVIAVAVLCRQNSQSQSNGVTALTVDGVSASQVSGAGNWSESNIFSDIWYANMAGDNNTSGNIVITLGANAVRCSFAVYRIVTSTATPSSGINAGNTATLAVTTGSLTVPSGGGAFAAFSQGAANTTCTWTNTTLSAGDYCDNLAALNTMGSATVSATGTISVTLNTNPSSLAVSAAAWGP